MKSLKTKHNPLYNKEAISLRKIRPAYFTVFFYLILISISLSGCSKDNDETPVPEPEVQVPPVPPTLELSSGETEVFNAILGSPTLGALDYEIKAVAKDGFKSLTIYKVFEGTSSAYETIDTNHPDYVANSNEFEYKLNYSLNKEIEVEKELYFKAVITDVNNSTATLDFAETYVRKPMTKSNIKVQTIISPVNNTQHAYYLYMKKENSQVFSVLSTQAEDVDFDEDIFAIFSVNDGSGYYLESPNILLETVLTDGMEEKSSTKFKERIYGSPFELGLDTAYNIFDVYKIEYAYNLIEHNSHEEKAENVDTVGKRFFFKTDDDRTGVLQIKNFVIEESIANLEIDILVTQ